MAWMHYTAPLAAGEELTAAMRRELWEALAERASIYPGASVDMSYYGDFETAGLVTTKVRSAGVFNSSATPAVFPFHFVLTSLATGSGVLSGSLAWRYTRGDTRNVAASWTSADFNNAVASSQGLTYAQLDAIGQGSIDDRRYWNAMRYGITLLAHHRFPSTGTFTYDLWAGRDFTPPSTWADAIANYAFDSSGGGTAGSDGRFDAKGVYSSGFYTAVADANIVSYAVPSLSIYSGGRVRFWVDIVCDAGGVAQTSQPVTLSFVGSDVELTTSADADESVAFDFILGAGDLGATRSLVSRFTAFANTTLLSALEPVPGVTIQKSMRASVRLVGDAFDPALNNAPTGLASPAWQYP